MLSPLGGATLALETRRCCEMDTRRCGDSPGGMRRSGAHDLRREPSGPSSGVRSVAIDTLRLWGEERPPSSLLSIASGGMRLGRFLLAPDSVRGPPLYPGGPSTSGRRRTGGRGVVWLPLDELLIDVLSGTVAGGVELKKERMPPRLPGSARGVVRGVGSAVDAPLVGDVDSSCDSVTVGSGLSADDLRAAATGSPGKKASPAVDSASASVRSSPDP